MSTESMPEPESLILDAIEAAEAIADPLAGLVERTATDPGAPFMAEALEALAALKRDNRAAFEALRSQLKRAGARVTELDDAIAEENGDQGGRGPTQADILIDLAQSVALFHAPDGSGYADLDINGHRETWPIRAKGFRRWLARRFFEETGGAPSSEALQSALNVIEAKARFDAPERQVHIRVGGLDGRLYLDLGDEAWRAIEIDATGWRIVDSPPIRFRRASGMKAMPIPVSGGSIETLRSFLNVQTDADFVLVVAWALACLRNRGPYPVIVLSGSRVRRNRPSRRSCGRCSIRTLRHCGLCRARIATCSSPPATAMCSRSTTCRAFPPGYRTRFAASPRAAGSRCANSIPIRMKFCSTPRAP